MGDATRAAFGWRPCVPSKWAMDALIFVVFGPAITILWHELAHALFALALTPREVTLTVGFGPSVGVRIGRLDLRRPGPYRRCSSQRSRGTCATHSARRHTTRSPC